MEASLGYSAAGDQDNVPTASNCGIAQADCFPQETLHAIPRYGAADSLAYHEAGPTGLLLRASGTEDEQ